MLFRLIGTDVPRYRRLQVIHMKEVRDLIIVMSSCDKDMGYSSDLVLLIARPETS